MSTYRSMPLPIFSERFEAMTRNRLCSDVGVVFSGSVWWMLSLRTRRAEVWLPIKIKERKYFHPTARTVTVRMAGAAAPGDCDAAESDCDCRLRT